MAFFTIYSLIYISDSAYGVSFDIATQFSSLVLLFHLFTPVGRNYGNMLADILHFDEYTSFQRQCLDIHYLNLAQISGCKPICTIIMDSLVDPSSCSTGNVTLAFLCSYIQINHASGSVWDLHCHCAVWICSSLIPLRARAHTYTQTHCYRAKPIKGVRMRD